jgi:type I restriction enzyme R subunit
MSHNKNLDLEAALERETVALFEQLGWETVDAYEETFGPLGTLGRDNRGEVVLAGRLRQALERLNPELPGEALALALEDLQERYTFSMELLLD